MTYKNKTFFLSAIFIGTLPSQLVGEVVFAGIGSCLLKSN